MESDGKSISFHHTHPPNLFCLSSLEAMTGKKKSIQVST